MDVKPRRILRLGAITIDGLSNDALSRWIQFSSKPVQIFSNGLGGAAKPAFQRLLRPATALPRRAVAGLARDAARTLGAGAGYSPALRSRVDQYSQARACGRGSRLRSQAIRASPLVSGLSAAPCALHINCSSALRAE